MCGSGESTCGEVVDDGALKTCDKIERGCGGKLAKSVGGAFAASERCLARIDFGLQLGMATKMVEHRRLDSAETEIKNIALHFGFAEADCFGIAVLRELVENGTAGIAEREHASNFVVGFAGSVVASAAD